MDTVRRPEDELKGVHTIAKQFVQFFVIADGKLKMSGDNTLLLVITGSISGEFQYLCSKIFEYGCEVNGSSSANTLGIVSALQHTVNTTNGKLIDHVNIRSLKGTRIN